MDELIPLLALRLEQIAHPLSYQICKLGMITASTYKHQRIQCCRVLSTLYALR